MTGTDAAAASLPADPVLSIHALAAEHAALVRRLRSAQIPQHVGMAAACRALAVELPRVLAAQVDAELQSGALAQRWAAIRAAAAEPGASELTALALLLREQGRAAMRHLLLREKEWAADAYRLEGQAGALEATIERLQRVAADPAGAASEAGR